jgi:hypothetical protein
MKKLTVRVNYDTYDALNRKAEELNMTVAALMRRLAEDATGTGEYITLPVRTCNPSNRMEHVIRRTLISETVAVFNHGFTDPHTGRVRGAGLIPAIIYVRQNTGLGLPEGKDVTEQILANAGLFQYR